MTFPTYRLPTHIVLWSAKARTDDRRISGVGIGATEYELIKIHPDQDFTVVTDPKKNVE